MVDTLMHFILRKFIIIGILIPVLLVMKFVVYRRLQNSTQRLTDYFYYTYANIATTHSPDRKKDKKLQNSLFFMLLICLFIQFIISLPVILNKN